MSQGKMCSMSEATVSLSCTGGGNDVILQP